MPFHLKTQLLQCIRNSSSTFSAKSNNHDDLNGRSNFDVDVTLFLSKCLEKINILVIIIHTNGSTLFTVWKKCNCNYSNSNNCIIINYQIATPIIYTSRWQQLVILRYCMSNLDCIKKALQKLHFVIIFASLYWLSWGM